MDLSCVLSKFCSDELAISSPHQCTVKTQEKLTEFKSFLQNQFVEKALGNLGLGEYSFVYKRKVRTVLLALELDIYEALASQIYTIIKKAQGIANAPRLAPVRWVGDDGFVRFRNKFYKDICELIPSIQELYRKDEVIPDLVIHAGNLKKVFDQVKVVPLKEMEKQIKSFCTGE